MWVRYSHFWFRCCNADQWLHLYVGMLRFEAVPREPFQHLWRIITIASAGAICIYISHVLRTLVHLESILRTYRLCHSTVVVLPR